MIDTIENVFGGFTVSDGTSCTVALPANWPEVSKAIDNLAELKVVQLVLWTTWGAGQADALMPLTLGDFMECTGLSEQSVRTGLKKAMEHGYIVRETEHKICFYGIKLQAQDLEEAQDLDPNFWSDDDEAASQADAQDLEFSSSNELERDINITNSEDILRNQEANNLHPCKGLTRADNATLCCRVESLSKALGDHEHIASNVGQARRILARYQASGGNFEKFLLLMYEARDLARRKTKIRRPNRMPYFFKCLRTACEPVELAA